MLFIRQAFSGAKVAPPPFVCKYCNDAAVNEDSQLECFSVMQLKRLHLRWTGQNIGQQR